MVSMGLFGIFTYREHDTLSMHRAILRTPQVQIFAALDMADSKRSTAKGGLKMETTDTTNMRTITVCPACRGRTQFDLHFYVNRAATAGWTNRYCSHVGGVSRLHFQTPLCSGPFRICHVQCCKDLHLGSP